MNNDAEDSKRLTVIYLRDRGTSAAIRPADEERQHRQRLLEAGVDPADALVLNDVPASGVPSRRCPPFQRLVGLLEAGRVGMLAMTSPSALVRGPRVWHVIRAMTEHGVTLVTADGPWNAKTLGILAMVQETATTLQAARARRRSSRRLSLPPV